MSNLIGLSETNTHDGSSRSELVDLPRKKKNSRQEKLKRLEKGLRQARNLILEELSSSGASSADGLVARYSP